MKAPQSAPTLPALFEKYSSQLPVVFEKVHSPLHSGRYLHWDDIRRKTPPGGLTEELYWFGLKIRRTPNMQAIRLQDKTGRPFSFSQPDPIPRALHEIDLRAGGRIETALQVTNPEMKDRYYISSLIEEAVTSSQIEGAVTTRRVAKEMLRSGRSPSNTSERMIWNNYITMKRIGELRDRDLTPDLIFELHRLITKDTLDSPDQAGRFRQANEPIDVGNEVDGTVYHIPPAVEELSDRLEQMCIFANHGREGEPFIHPVLRAIMLHFWLAYDHPFVDGNGRTARALFYWSMLRSGYWLFEFVSISHVIKKSKIKYYKSFLHTETDENDLTYFLIYNLQVIEEAIVALNRYLHRKTKEIHRLEREMKVLQQFNHRQKALLAHALRHPWHKYTFESHCRSHGVVRQTARTDILDLLDKGLLIESTQGVRRTFAPVGNLEQILKSMPETDC